MDWRMKTMWWLLGALLLVPALTPAEAGHGSGGRRRRSTGRGSWGSGGQGPSSTQTKSRDHQDTQASTPVTENDTRSQHVRPQGHFEGYGGCQHYQSLLAGSGYYGHQKGYPSSQGFGRDQGGSYLGGGSQWNPPGYTPTYSGMSRLHSSPFGYMKNSLRPSIPMIFCQQLPHYHHSLSLPSRTTWGCDCFVKDRTAVCMEKLKDGRIPSCVNSSVTAVSIQSEEVDRMSGDAFRHVPHLEYINIIDTMLRSLPSGLFRYTRYLKHLLVQKNPDLRSLDSDVFRDATNLEDVILERNDISSLERDVFTHLTNVKRLNLAYNKIRFLTEGIFRNNRQLEELVLSGNPLRLISRTARDLLTNNTKLKVLQMRNCKLQYLPADLLRNATNLEWLDLSRNQISKFPLESIEVCKKLVYLGLAYNRLKVLSSDMLYQYGRHLAVLDLEGNPWHCDCDLMPLAAWATLRNDAVPGWPKCSSPKNVHEEPLQRWFHSGAQLMCGAASPSLRTNLNRVLTVARAIAQQGPTYFANLLPVSDEEVSLTATNYFLYAMASLTDADVDSVVWHWARMLEKVLDRRHLRHAESTVVYGINMMLHSDMEQILRIELDKKGRFSPNVGLLMDPLSTTTTKPPAARGIERPMSSKGFEPLVNFTYIMKNIPENLTKVVDDGIEEELKTLFGHINGTNATSWNSTAAKDSVLSSTGPDATTVSPSGAVLPPHSANATEQTVAGLRSELRDVLSILVQSIDRANWDAAYHKFITEKEYKARKHNHRLL